MTHEPSIQPRAYAAHKSLRCLLDAAFWQIVNPVCLEPASRVNELPAQSLPPIEALEAATNPTKD
jgi:hypothetical protein